MRRRRKKKSSFTNFIILTAGSLYLFAMACEVQSGDPPELDVELADAQANDAIADSTPDTTSPQDAQPDVVEDVIEQPDVIEPEEDAEADAGDSGTDAADAADTGTPTGCVPTGTANGAPTGVASPGAQCPGSRFIWSGTNLGTSACFRLGTTEFSGSGSIGIPTTVAPGTYTMSVTGPGGTHTTPFTVTAGTPPVATTLTPSACAPGTEVTATGTGFDGLTSITVSSNGGASANAPIKTNTGTAVTFDCPNLAAGFYKVEFFENNCGSSAFDLTLQAPASTLSACWQAAAGTYSSQSQGCGLSPFSVVVNPSSITANPFGANGSVSFSGQDGVTLSATNQTIFGVGNHLCHMACSQGQITTSCSNPQGGQCSQFSAR